MMHREIATYAGGVVRRALTEGPVDGGDGAAPPAQLPGWAVLVIFADALVFLPVFIYIGYTLSHIYPTIAMVEDPLPPAYAAVSLSDSAAANANSSDAMTTPPGAAAAAHNKAVDEAPPLTSTSLRRINRLLYATGGWTASLRGLGCAVALDLVSGVCGAAVGAFVPRAFGVLLAALATVQLHTVWTHIVVTVPSELPFWRRLPDFGKTFRATWAPVAAYWAARQFTALVPVVLAGAFGLDTWDPRAPGAVPVYSGHAVWQSLVVLLATLLSAVCLVIPAQVVLVRVQASLLPADADTIVPFDRSFGGAVEPEVVTGKGYVDFVTAWRTFGRDSWVRLLRLMGKIVAVTLAVYLVFLALVVPEFLLMLRVSN